MDKNEVFNGNTVRLIPLWKWLLAEENLPVALAIGGQTTAFLPVRQV